MKIIRYCPGQLCGSPAYMTERQAAEQLNIDATKLLVRSLGRGQGWPNSYLPHTGPCTWDCPGKRFENK